MAFLKNLLRIVSEKSKGQSTGVSPSLAPGTPGTPGTPSPGRGNRRYRDTQMALRVIHNRVLGHVREWLFSSVFCRCGSWIRTPGPSSDSNHIEQPLAQELVLVNQRDCRRPILTETRLPCYAEPARAKPGGCVPLSVGAFALVVSEKPGIK